MRTLHIEYESLVRCAMRTLHIEKEEGRRQREEGRRQRGRITNDRLLTVNYREF
jgi:hypothetical protein